MTLTRKGDFAKYLCKAMDTRPNTYLGTLGHFMVLHQDGVGRLFFSVMLLAIPMASGWEIRPGQ
jgi:hypothetical protein